MKKEKVFKTIVVLFLVLSGYYIYTENFTGETVTIANWNLQIFGDAKSSDPQLLIDYASIIDNYDIIFIQEIRDKDGSSFKELCFLLPNYQCEISSRAGRSSSKEQYGIIFKNGINLTELKDFNPDEQDRWERPPIEATFQINETELIIYNLHSKPDDVKNELSALESIVNDNSMILGDLNADCSYYSPEKEPEFDSWNWVIPDNADTTTGATDCAYDRIILGEEINYKNYGIYKKIDSNLSDHYLVWIEIKLK